MLKKVKGSLHRPKAQGGVGYSSTLSLASALEGGGVANIKPRPLYPGKDPIHIVQEAVRGPGPVWTGAENLAPSGIRSPDRPARSQPQC
jgi:hypothetical protein